MVTKYCFSFKQHSIWIFLTLCFSYSLKSQQIIIEPYLQNAEPNSIVISWETDSNNESIVDWGTDSLNLSNQDSGTFISSLGGSKIHHTELDSLNPGTLYYYRVKTGAAISDTFHFRSPALASAEESALFVAASDMQIDNGNPAQWNEIVEDGIINYVNAHYGNNLSEQIAFALIPGDLVSNGLSYNQWKNDFFNPAQALFSYVPVYPILGNHEANAPFYFDYFELPQNGTSGSEEHWWYKDYSNMRIIGLNSNSPYDGQSQLDWLDTLLNNTCSNPEIDFVFAQLHHPHQSELWPPGESNFTGDVQSMLENFSTNCSKPSIHFFGHTHGYSRGQSQDHSHLMVNVATGGGNIDYWGEYGQIDYPDYTKSQDEYGFVIVETQAGANPKFTLKRLSQGDEFTTLANVLRDSITVYKNNLAPNTPVPQFPLNQMVNPDCITLVADPYSETEGDIHMASQWQISNNCLDFSSPVYESLRNHENWFFEVNTQANDDLTDELIVGLPANSSLCWRVRFRDHSLGWSNWSSPASFTTGTSSLSANLLLNPGAENDTVDWTVSAGFLESLTNGECSGVAPHSGQRYFAAGALCNEAAYGEAYQDVDVSTSASPIDSGTAYAHFGGWLRNWSGNDVPELMLYFLDAGNFAIDSTAKLSGATPTWGSFDQVAPIPAGTRSIRFVMMGTRNAGSDNDSYLDDLYLKLNLNGCETLVTRSDEGFPRLPKLTVSPNPVQDRARVEVAVVDGQAWEMSLMDIKGQVVLTRRGGDCAQIELNASGLAAGTYTLKLKIGSKTWIQKVMVVD